MLLNGLILGLLKPVEYVYVEGTFYVQMMASSLRTQSCKGIAYQ